MATNRTRDTLKGIATLPRVEVPPIRQATLKELARRRDLFEQTMELRDRIGPTGILADDLIHKVRAEAGR